MAPPRRWIRLDVGWSDSDWVGALDPAGRLSWIELLTYAKRDGAAGMVKALTPAAFGRKVRIPVADVEAMLAAAIGDGALEERDGMWIITNWPEYQETDRTAKERMRKYRSTKSAHSPLRRNTRNSPSQPVTGGVTRRVTETETETERTEGDDADASSLGFDDFWSSYPKRAGGNPKRKAEHAWNARIHEGADPAAILAGLGRYVAFMRHEGKLGTPYVMQAATFLGPDCRWAEDWAVPRNGNSADEKLMRHRQELDRVDLNASRSIFE